MENIKEPKLIERKKIGESEEKREFVQAATGPDKIPHKFQAVYIFEKYEERYGDGSVREKTKTILKPNTLKDLGPVKETEQEADRNQDLFKKAA